MTEAAATRPPGFLARLLAAGGREGDRPMIRPPDLVAGIDDPIGWPRAFAHGCQQLAIQSVFFVLPLLLAAELGADAAAATNFAGLTALGLAAFSILQLLPRGPIGSGYPIVAIPSPILFAAYVLAARAGADPAQIAALTVLVGVASIALVPLLRRIQMLLPTEVAGVVVFLIGASLLPVVMATLQLDPVAPRGALPGVALALAGFALMGGVALGRWRLAPFALLVGAVGGGLVALALGLPGKVDPTVVGAWPWFAPPHPVLPEWRGLDPAMALPFLLCLVANKASLVGNLVAFQRTADAGWRRLDPGPVRRGMLAQGAAIVLAGLFGAMGPAASSACLGLIMATRMLARRAALAGAGLLVLLALSPKLLGLLLLVPEPIKAAMLLYVAGFMMAQGCQMIVARMLDARRTLVTGLGLSAGLAVLIAPGFFLAALPQLASPLAFGVLVTLAAHLLTLPLVARRARFVLPLGPGMAGVLAERWTALGGGWGLTRPTVQKVEHALTELGDLLAGRGLRRAEISAWVQEDRLEVVLAFEGARLPPPARRPRATDLEGSVDALEGFGVWLATRDAVRHAQRPTGTGHELRLEFQD